MLKYFRDRYFNRFGYDQGHQFSYCCKGDKGAALEGCSWRQGDLLIFIHLNALPCVRDDTFSSSYEACGITHAIFVRHELTLEAFGDNPTCWDIFLEDVCSKDAWENPPI